MAGPGVDQLAVSPPLDLDEPFVAARCRHRALRQRRRGDGRIRVQWTHDPNLPGPTVRLSPPSGEERDWRDFYDWYDAVQCHRVLDPVAGAFQNYGDDGYCRDQWGGLNSLDRFAKLSVDRQFFPRAVPGAALEHAFEHPLRQLVILRV